MARAVITSPTVPSTAGVTVTPATFTADGIAIPNGAKRALRVTNGSGASVNITEKFGPSAAVDGVAPADRVVAVAAAATKWFGPWSGAYAQDDGHVYIDVSSPTSVTYEVVEITPK
ncbi:hypothetical protein [Nonomuraea bangladeshensis]|uniref:hypothetical protein n=1 Tax=Nonomuraea bangladeshensis TaxID=404385 RepID=UPI003C2DBB8D